MVERVHFHTCFMHVLIALSLFSFSVVVFNKMSDPGYPTRMERALIGIMSEKKTSFLETAMQEELDVGELK